ncbi:MAG: BatD family protein [Ginsengibacter sp.]
MNEILLSGNNKRIYIFLLSLFFALCKPSVSFAQVKFSAVCPNKKIGKNEYLQVQYIVENASNVEQIVPPPFKNFVVLSGPNQQSSMSNINGTVSQSVAIEFVLKPNVTGTFILPPATAKVNGKTLLSNSLSVEVTNNSTGASSGGASISPFGNFMDVPPVSPLRQYDDYILHKGENLGDKIKKNLFVKLDVNKTSCYVGEPIVATYKLYTRLKSESNLTKSPSFNGFSVSEMEMPDSYTIKTEKYNGRQYSVYILRKVQLYPLQPGTVQLDPIEVENHITFIKAEYANTKRGDIFYDMLRDFADATTPPEGMEQQKITLQSKPLNITISPLPQLNQPKNFKGAIGNFNIYAAIEKKSMTTDEAGSLSVSIFGNGNIQMVNAPDIAWPQGIEAFEPKSSESIDKTAVPLKGQKIFNYIFTVSKSGMYKIPAISFSYFDVAARDYKILSTSPITIDIKKGIGIKPAIAGKLKSLNNNNPNDLNTEFSGWRWLLLIVAFLITGLIIWFISKPGKKEPPLTPASDKNIIDKEIKPGEKEEVKIPVNPLHEAEMILAENNANNFYYTLNNCLRSYLSQKLNFPKEELSKKSIYGLLDKSNVGVGTSLMLSSLLEAIEINLYAPHSSANQMQEMYEKASEVVALLDKQMS